MNIEYYVAIRDLDVFVFKTEADTVNFIMDVEELDNELEMAISYKEL